MLRAWRLSKSNRYCYKSVQYAVQRTNIKYLSIPTLSVHQNCKLIGNVNGWVTVLLGWIAYGAYKHQNNQPVIAETNNKGQKTDMSLMEYQYKISEYIEHKQFDEMIDFLWKELIRIANIGSGDAETIDFLETKLCGYLCKMGKAMDALKIVEPYTEEELIANQSLLRVAFVYHAAQKWKRAINLYKLMQQHIEQQLLNKVKHSDLPIIQKEVMFITNMHLAQCYVGMNDIERAKSVYLGLQIEEVVEYGADEQIFGFYQEFGTKEDMDAFIECVESYVEKEKPQTLRKCPV